MRAMAASFWSPVQINQHSLGGKSPTIAILLSFMVKVNMEPRLNACFNATCVTYGSRTHSCCFWLKDNGVQGQVALIGNWLQEVWLQGCSFRGSWG